MAVFMYEASAGSVWVPLLVLLLGIISIFGNSVIIWIIRLSQRFSRLVNFCMCFLAVNNIVESATGILGTLSVSLCNLVWSDSLDVPSNCSQLEPNHHLLKCLNIVAGGRLAILLGSSGSQFWILVLLVVRSNAVMVTRLKKNRYTLAVCAVVLLGPYILSFGLYSVSEKACAYLFVVFWVAPLACFVITSFRSSQTENDRRSSDRHMFRRVRISSQIMFTPRYRFRTWTTEAFHVVSVAVLCQAIFWTPFYSSLASTIFSSSPQHENAVICISLSCLLSAVFLPMFFYASSSKFREGCNRLTTRRRLDPNAPPSRIQNLTYRRNHTNSDTFPLQPRPMRPREPIVVNNVSFGILKNARSKSEDISNRTKTVIPNSKRSISFDVASGRDHWQYDSHTKLQLKRFNKVSPDFESDNSIGATATFKFLPLPGDSGQSSDQPCISLVLAKSIMLPYHHGISSDLANTTNNESTKLPKIEELD